MRFMRQLRYGRHTQTKSDMNELLQKQGHLEQRNHVQCSSCTGCRHNCRSRSKQGTSQAASSITCRGACCCSHVQVRW